MAIDMRVINSDCVHEVVECLRNVGLTVDLTQRAVHPTLNQSDRYGSTSPIPPFTIREIHCQRGKCKIKLSVLPEDNKADGYRICITHTWSWLPGRNRRLKKLQSELTLVLESYGAYWPFA